MGVATAGFSLQPPFIHLKYTSTKVWPLLVTHGVIGGN